MPAPARLKRGVSLSGAVGLFTKWGATACIHILLGHLHRLMFLLVKLSWLESGFDRFFQRVYAVGLVVDLGVPFVA